MSIWQMDKVNFSTLVDSNVVSVMSFSSCQSRNAMENKVFSWPFSHGEAPLKCQPN